MGEFDPIQPIRPLAAIDGGTRQVAGALEKRREHGHHEEAEEHHQPADIIILHGQEDQEVVIESPPESGLGGLDLAV